MSTEQLVQLLWQGLLETLRMTIPSTLFALVCRWGCCWW